MFTISFSSERRQLDPSFCFVQASPVSPLYNGKPVGNRSCMKCFRPDDRLIRGKFATAFRAFCLCGIHKMPVSRVFMLVRTFTTPVVAITGSPLLFFFGRNFAEFLSLLEYIRGYVVSHCHHVPPTPHQRATPCRRQSVPSCARLRLNLGTSSVAPLISLMKPLNFVSEPHHNASCSL